MINEDETEIHQSIPARRLEFGGGVTQEEIISFLGGLEIIDTVFTDAESKKVVVQFFGENMTESIIASTKRRSISLGGKVLRASVQEGDGLLIGGDFASIMRSSQAVDNYCAMGTQTRWNWKVPELINEILVQHIRRAFNRTPVEFYGSHAQNLQSPGDYNTRLFIGTAESLPSDEEVTNLTAKLGEVLQAAPNIFSKITRVNSSVYCHFQCVSGSVRCEFSFTKGLECRNSLMVKKMLQLDHRVRPMIMFLKEWSMANGLNFYFTAYIAALMTFFLLHRLDILPPLSLLQQGAKSVKIGVWECGMVEELPEWKPKGLRHTTGTLLAEFFKYYAEFNFKDFVICPLTGSCELRSEVKSTTPLLKKERMYVMGCFDNGNAAQRIANNEQVFDAMVHLFKKSDRAMARNRLQ